MKNNILNLNLKITLLVIFVFTSTGYVMPGQPYLLDYPALRPLASKIGGPTPVLSGPIRDDKQKTKDRQRKPYPPSDWDRLSGAKFFYSENKLSSLATASDILLDYIYSADEELRKEAKAILMTRDNLLVIRDEPKETYIPGKTDYPAGTVPSKKIFENNIRAGIIKPVVIVNIKKVYPKIELAYAAELRKISRYYNGNLTFILKVEKMSPPADLPGAKKALYDTIQILGDEDFKNTFSVQILDGGFKTRLGPILLRYHKLGLVPYYRGISTLQEVFTRTGRALMQMPNMGKGDHIICASDNILEPESLDLDRSGDRDLQIAAVKWPTPTEKDVEQFALFLFDKGRPIGRVDDISLERTKEILKANESAYVNSLGYVLVWKKEPLSEHIGLAYSTKMHNGQPLAHLPINMHKEFSRSVFHTKEGWGRLYPEWKQSHPDVGEDVTIEDWMKMRESALKALGQKAERVNFVDCQVRDEGTFEQLIDRFKKSFRGPNQVKRDPGIMLGNASEAVLDRVVIRGKKGAVIFGGPGVRLRNVVIDLEEGECLYIPDNWAISDSYIGKNTFEEGGEVLFGATLYKEGRLHPLKDRVIKSKTCNSVISLLEEEPEEKTVLEEKPTPSLIGEGPMYISAELDAPTTIKTRKGNLEFEELQWNIDAAANWQALSMLHNIIDQEFEGMPAPYPLNMYSARGKSGQPLGPSIHGLAGEIVDKQKAEGGGQYDVFIDGIQGTDRTTNFAERLTESLNNQGKNAVLIRENWYYKSLAERDRLRKEEPEEWKRHDKSWHRWAKLQQDFITIHTSKEGEIVLEELYNESTGRCDLKKTFRVTKDTIFIYTGFYAQDIAKLYGQDIRDLSSLPLRPSTRIYLGLSKKDSLKFKLKRGIEWLTPNEIEFQDKEVYSPAFRRYFYAYDPAGHSDYVFGISIKDPERIIEVDPHTRLWQQEERGEIRPPVGKNAVIFGAGAIGRGMFGLNFRRSGYKISFVEAEQELVRRLREDKRYAVVTLRRLPESGIENGTSKDKREYHYINKVTVISQNEIGKIEKLVSSADAICLAVPDEYLPEVCSLLGRCLQERVLRGNENPVNIFLATNRLKAKEYVEDLIRKGIAEENQSLVLEHAGIVETVVEGITRLGTEKEEEKERVLLGKPGRPEEEEKLVNVVYGDSYNRFLTDKGGFKGDIPRIDGMKTTKDIDKQTIDKHKRRKLFLFRAAYSFIAYLGYLRGYEYINQAWEDPWIKNEAENLIRIASAALIKECGFSHYGQEAFIRDLRDRFCNETLKDPLVRAARDPLRKLRSDERFVGLARLIGDTDVEQEGIVALAIAACLRYDNPEDKESKRLQDMGLEGVLREICQIEPDSRLGRLIIEKYQQFEKFGVAYAGLTLIEPKPTEGTTHILMGFDGVVANTNPILRRHFAYIYWKIINAISDDEKREPSEDELSEGKNYFDKILGRYFIGDIIKDVILLASERGVRRARLKSAKEYLAEYRKRQNAEIKAILNSNPEALLVPGIRELLERLKGLNKKIYLLTKAHRHKVNEILEVLKLKDYFTKDGLRKVKDLKGKISELGDIISSEKIKLSNVVFVDDSPWVIEEVRRRLGPGLHIVAIRERVGKNDRELFSPANFILDDFSPSPNKLSIFLRTKGLVVPEGFSLTEQRDIPAGPIGAQALCTERELTTRINSAA